MQKRNLTRKDLAKEIYKKLGFSKNFLSSFVEVFFDNISNEIIKNNKIKISSFGTFEVQSKKQRLGRNPKTKEQAIIMPRKIIKFKSSSSFKKKLND